MSWCDQVKGQAATCQLTEACQCGREVSFSDRMQRHVIIRGVADRQIRRVMMGGVDPDKSLKRLISAVESKEAGNRAHNQCARPESSEHTGDSVDAGNNYRRLGRQPTTPNPALRGATANPTAPPASTAAAAMTATTGKLIAQHTEPLAPSAQNSTISLRYAPSPNTPTGGRLQRRGPPTQLSASHLRLRRWSAPCSVTSSRHSMGILDHHVFDKPSGTWIKRASKPQPYVRLTATTSQADYRKLNRRLTKEGSTSIEAMADTGGAKAAS